MRDDERIRDALLKAGKLNPGPKVELTDVSVIQNSEEGTILEYTFKVTNMSGETLYLPDPDKMSNELFHYYTNGISLTDVNDYRSSLWSEDKTVISPEPFNSWKSEWFMKVGTGQSFTRTVRLDGYSQIAESTYTCAFFYGGPLNIQKDERQLSDGRIWLGQVESSTFEIDVKN